MFASHEVGCQSPGNTCPCCGPNQHVHRCNHCAASPQATGQSLLRCSACKATWYCSKKCQKENWKQHRLVCAELSQQPTLVRGLITDLGEPGQNTEGPISPETLKALNTMTAPAEFIVTAAQDFVVQFPSPELCFVWCEIMNLAIFPHQEGAIIFIRQGMAAKMVGPVFRFPMEFYHWIQYLFEGRIFYNSNEQKWQFRNVSHIADVRAVGHFEDGYGIEPFLAWHNRQVQRLLLVRPSMQAYLADKEEKESKKISK